MKPAAVLYLSFFALLLVFQPGLCELVQRTFRIGELRVRKLCKETTVIAVNGRLPGPSLQVREGDSLVIHAVNDSPYNISLHWHGIFQRLTAWADGPEHVTQCPIPPGSRYTYRFSVIGQEGTLWWHAHSSFLRATVYGSLIIRPRRGASYPFPPPRREVPLLLGEWWNANPVEVDREALLSGGGPNNSDAYTINGKPGAFYPCSRDQTFKLKIVYGKTYLLRIINAALNQQFFFAVAGHQLKVVAVDASYTVPYLTDVVAIAPGQTVDALLDAAAAPGKYYMAARSYASAPQVPFHNGTTAGLLYYAPPPSPSSPPIVPTLPSFNDTPAAHKFYSNLSALLRPSDPRVPLDVDEEMFITLGLGLVDCDRKNATCAGPLGQRLAASMNNNSFVLPTEVSLLQAHFFKVAGVFTEDFPDRPPAVFDYTSPNVSVDVGLLQTAKNRRAKRLKYNSAVEVVLQNTALLVEESHPIHLHGFNFFVLAQGFGNYDPILSRRSFNLENPLVRNTIAVPVGGWAVIRFVADNPGVWFMHCHIDTHMPWGLGMVFVVEDGQDSSSKLPPPPPDLPRCR